MELYTENEIREKISEMIAYYYANKRTLRSCEYCMGAISALEELRKELGIKYDEWGRDKED